jgi:hypothetical protein
VILGRVSGSTPVQKKLKFGSGAVLQRDRNQLSLPHRTDADINRPTAPTSGSPATRNSGTTMRNDETEASRNSFRGLNS